ncbi:sensor histidine kinase [Brevibacillus composti]|uniref:histidine kinase n=1 Tax=Brevibacillus composti TaxID=2796470 RepID=A0A7T5EJP7_9BACL|nr:sensor histidine kinase [Brevibacillus composti]QQE73864.1 sensor histidine kinase [Brevibacillus composti]QUO40949.1 sensor histidine kinase [Brevibacillus composti]
MRESLYILLVMLLAVPIAGELKFHPFQDDFRISFGTTAFFFFLLWLRKIPAYLTGTLTGLAVVLFRLGLDWLTYESFDLVSSVQMHFPAFFFYVTFSLIFSLARVNQLHQFPLLVGILATVAEIAANLVELAFRSPHWHAIFQWEVISPVAVIALIRSFFVLSFFNMIQLRQAKWMEEQQRVRNEHMLMLVSNLYEESIHLKKTLQDVEEITRDCYELYRQLKQDEAGGQGEEYARQALRIAGQVHEVKKDNQRIFAGLSKLISDENDRDYMPLGELMKVVVRANEKYARLLGKDISFTHQVGSPYLACHIFTTLSLLNNLVANAVEAIRERGTIAIEVKLDADKDFLFTVKDDGPGIVVRDRELLFMPGFTTKYDVSGNPSTGIGLSYVKEVVENLKGQVELLEGTEGYSTVFRIRLPIANLVQKG